MAHDHQRPRRRSVLRHRLLAFEARLREVRQRRDEQRAQRHAQRTAQVAAQQAAIDPHDHAAMLVRWQHWLAWLQAQRLEVEQRMAARASGDDEEVTA